ncbi:MAG: hypothetical protein K9M57_09590, partial [Phycisphaerae bacterium]|nr:hypothetical protein [Phycisphaerae bacterium]
MLAVYHIYFSQPLWLLAAFMLLPMMWLSWPRMAALGPKRRIAAVILRCVVILLLIGLLARPKLTRENQHITVISVLDRSLSIPENLRQAGKNYLDIALAQKDPKDKIGIIDIAEAADIRELPN